MASLAAMLIFVVCVRVRLMNVPLERDEGEYAYMGQLILQGVPPYAAAHNMKLPGVYYAYAGIFAVLGQTDVDIRLALLVINAISILLVYRLARRLLGDTAALTAAVAFALLSLSQASYGFTANTEHFVVLPMLAGVLLLVPAEPGRHRPLRALAAGLLLGIAFLMKQHGAAFIVFGGLYLLLSGEWRAATRSPLASRIAVCGLFGAGAVLPFALLCLLMFVQGVFQPFWFWTFTYARTYVTQNTPAAGIILLSGQLSRHAACAPLFWLLAAIGATALAWDAPTRRRALFLGLFAGCSFLAVCPGLVFREHYFVMLLPAVALLVGAGVIALGRLAGRSVPRAAAYVPVLVTTMAAAVSLYIERDYLFIFTPTAVARSVYGLNPFPEAVEIGTYIRLHSNPQDEIAVIGSEPQIYFYAGRRAATTYVYTYPLVEMHPFARTMQEELIAQVESRKPRYLVMVNVPTSWLVRPGASLRIFEWAKGFAEAHYQVVGVADIRSAYLTEFWWDNDARNHPPQSSYNMLLFEHKVDDGRSGPHPH
jgi:hypothetical protein